MAEWVGAFPRRNIVYHLPPITHCPGLLDLKVRTYQVRVLDRAQKEDNHTLWFSPLASLVVVSLWLPKHLTDTIYSLSAPCLMKRPIRYEVRAWCKCLAASDHATVNFGGASTTSFCSVNLLRRALMVLRYNMCRCRQVGKAILGNKFTPSF